MPDTTAKGVPFPIGSDAAADIDTIVQTLAEWVDANPGTAAFTTAERDALAGADLWNGRLIYNSDEARLESYDTTAAEWSAAGGGAGDVTAERDTTLTYTDGDLTAIEYFDETPTRVARDDLTYTGDDLTQTERKEYDEDGVTVLRTITTVLTYDGSGNLESTDVTVVEA